MTEKVVLLNDEALRRPATTVGNADLEYVNTVLVPRMVEVMKAERGMGLAANQVADPLNVFILDTNGELGIYINASVISSEEEILHEEGCLSIPGATGMVPRFNKLKLKFQDEKLEHKEISLEGIQAIAVQHEIDHLQGILYIDTLGEVSRMMVLNKHKKFMKMKSRMERR